jgi:hypothetical protein
MADAHSPESDPTNAPAHNPSQPWPGIGRVVISIPESLLADPDDGPVVFDDPDLLALALSDAEDARLHLAAMLGILRSVHPAYKIEAGLYLGNLQNIHARLVRLIEGLSVLVD